MRFASWCFHRARNNLGDMNKRWMGAGLALAVLAGCEVGPNYHAPKTEMPAAWVTPPTTQASRPVETPEPVVRWWTLFDDSELNSLIDRAAESNLDVEAATERVRQARAEVGIARAGLFPQASFSGSYSRGASGTGSPQPLWEAGLDAIWEIDIFGGIRRNVEAAEAGVGAAVENRRDVMITLMGEVATDYIDIRGFQQEIAIAEDNLQTQAKNVDLTIQKQRLGTDTELDIVQAKEAVATTRAGISALELQEEQTIYALSILLALPPTALEPELDAPGPIPRPPNVVHVGLPSELLRRRPDIRAAERQLAAASATVGVAVAQLFPSFSLDGSETQESFHFQGLGNPANSVWSYGPSVTWTVFDAGSIWSNVAVQNAAEQQALTTYKQTVLAALLEVQNDLAAYVKDQERTVELEEAVRLDKRAVELSTVRFRQGQEDFLSVLVAEQSLLSSQDALVQSDRTVGTDVVALYKALGGGWEVAEPAPAATQPAYFSR
jgi:outer membrane protein, multidrug efflux system